MFGCAKVQRTEVSSSFSTVTTEPSGLLIHTGTDGINSAFCRIELYQNMMSSAVKGSPSDHFMPLRRDTVH